MNRWMCRVGLNGLGVKSVSFFVTFVLSLNSHAFNSIEYSNRAQCAIDSDSPAHSSWLILNSYNAQKLAHNFAFSTDQESQPWVKKASVEFRLGITHLTLKLMDKILRGELPLLPTNIKSDNGRLQVYRSIVKKCNNKLRCPELSEYLSKIWKVSDLQSADARFIQFSQIDHMSSADFIQTLSRRDSKKLHKDSNISSLSCYLIKNKSALQGALEKSRPNERDLESIARAWLNKEQYITNCFSQDPSLNLESTVLQLDIKTEDLNWKSVGFDFWNTVKIMTSWAWRHTSSLNQTSQSFHQLFKSMVLEESMMLMPNGCRSLTPQKCDSQTLSENSIRELAKLESQNQEHTSRIPEGPEKKLLKMSPPEVNRDILDIHRASDLNSWVQNFQKNMTSARGLSKNRIQNNLQIMDRISSSISQNQINDKLISLLQSSRSGNGQAKRHLHLVCQESRLALDKKLNFYQKDLEQTFSNQVLDRFNQNFERDPKKYLSFLDQTGTLVLKLCDLAADERLTEVSETLTSDMYRPWAQKFLYEDQPVTEPEIQVDPTQALLLWNPSAEVTSKNILCVDELECFRTFIDSAMQVRSALMYASAFLTHSGEILSSSMSNPYAELKACEIYDPWLKSKESFRNLLKDSLNTALFGWNYFPVYLDVTRGLPRVTSLNKVFESGILKFSPQTQDSQAQMNLMIDFGPLAGVPCSVSIANERGGGAITQMPYYLTGVTINYCDSKSELENRAIDAQTIRSQPQTTSKKCVGCTIGLVSAESAVSFYNSQAIAPIKFTVQIFKTISNFISARRDPVNIPHQVQVNPEYVARVFQQFNSIPSHCVDQLSKGLSCYQNLCAAQSAHEFERRTGVQVKNAIIVSQQDYGSESYVYVETPLCQGEIRFAARCDQSGQPYFDFRNLMSFEKDCQGAVKKLKQDLK